MHPYVHGTIYSSQDKEKPKMSIDRWMDEDVVHIYSGMLISHKKAWNNAICSNMDKPRDYHTKQSQSEKDKYYMISLIKWNLKYKTNQHIYETKTDP